MSSIFKCSLNHALVLLTNPGPFKCYVMQVGVGGINFSGKKHYEGVRFNVISVTRGWMGVQFPKNALRNTFQFNSISIFQNITSI